MELRYNLSERDIIAYYKNRASKNLFYSPYIFILVAVISFTLELLNSETTAKPNEYNGLIQKVSNIDFWIGVLIDTLIFSALVLAYRYGQLRKLKKEIRENPSISEVRVLEISEDKLILTSSASTTTYSINHIHNIKNEKDHYSIHINHNKEPDLIIPKNNQSVNFIQYLISKITNN